MSKALSVHQVLSVIWGACAHSAVTAKLFTCQAKCEMLGESRAAVAAFDVVSASRLRALVQPAGTSFSTQ